MCVVSMVHDHFYPKFPKDIEEWPGIVPVIPVTPASIPSGTVTITTGPIKAPFQIISNEEVEALQKLINDFKTAVEAAKAVDRLTGQPDCVDPEKKKLEERVAKLEQQIAQLLAEKQQ